MDRNDHATRAERCEAVSQMLWPFYADAVTFHARTVAVLLLGSVSLCDSSVDSVPTDTVVDKVLGFEPVKHCLLHVLTTASTPTETA